MSYWNQRALMLSEIQLGNLFYLPTVKTVMITGIHLTGEIQAADCISGEIINGRTFKDLTAIELPGGSNVDLLDYLLKDTEFEKGRNETYNMPIGKMEVILMRDMESWPKWKMYIKDDPAPPKVFEYVHELQNNFLQLTRSRINFLNNKLSENN